MTDPEPQVRVVPFATVFNFRDLGGYVGAGGATLRWRVLYRADSIAGLATADRDRFGSLGIRVVIDLRSAEEVAQHGPTDGIGSYEYLHIHPPHTGLGWDRYTLGTDVARFIADRYLLMAEQARSQFGRALCLVTNPRRWPLVMHCQVGRDRTGVLAALTLALAGVSTEQIVEDYVLSAEAVDRAFAWLRTNRPEEPLPAPHLVAAPAAAMCAFLTELGDRYGSIHAYAAAAGVPATGIGRLRDNLLH